MNLVFHLLGVQSQAGSTDLAIREVSYNPSGVNWSTLFSNLNANASVTLISKTSTARLAIQGFNNIADEGNYRAIY